MGEGMSETQAQIQRDGPEGIGGWLILPVIGVLLTPISGMIQLATYPDVFKLFPILSATQKLFLILEVLGNLAITIILPIVLLVLLFKKKAGFPRLYIIWAAFNFGFIIADIFVAKILFGDVFEATGTPLVDEETMKSIARGVVLVVIWIPYMLSSRRVRNTFVQ